MRPTTPRWYAAARCAATVLLGAVLALLGGADAAGARPWVAGTHCVTVQQGPATAPEPAPLLDAGADECPEPVERRRGHGSVPLDACAHRTGPARALGWGQLPPPRTGADAAGGPGRPERPRPARRDGNAAGAGSGRGVVLRC
ncbi:hypothetical protein [Kitasatospora sp. NPDC093806]|uniref:hypothetical protein n=1 Tax=Kitasatospora sp. NPDC093806 TaxID=3155075 RepID=UPI0034306C4B